MPNRESTVETYVRKIARDELSKMFSIAASPPTQTVGRAARNVGKGLVTNPKTDKRLKRNRKGNA